MGGREQKHEYGKRRQECGEDFREHRAGIVCSEGTEYRQPQRCICDAAAYHFGGPGSKLSGNARSENTGGNVDERLW